MTAREPIPDREIPIACALSGKDLDGRRDEVQDLIAAADEVAELPDGYAFRFPAEDPWPARLLTFVQGERRCCPFFAFEIAFEPGLGPLWLRLRGAEGVKAFVENTFLTPAETASPA